MKEGSFPSSVSPFLLWERGEGFPFRGIWECHNRKRLMDALSCSEGKECQEGKRSGDLIPVKSVKGSSSCGIIYDHTLSLSLPADHRV